MADEQLTRREQAELRLQNQLERPRSIAQVIREGKNILTRPEARLSLEVRRNRRSHQTGAAAILSG